MRFPGRLAVGVAVVLGVGLAAGCGRLGFDPIGGAAGDDTGGSPGSTGDAAGDGAAVCEPACGIGSYCQPAVGCSGPGTCNAALPSDFLCPDVFEPVCGCDGVTYGSDCHRGQSGVAKADEGECGGGSI